MSAGIERMKKEIKIVKEFVEALEKVGGKVPGPVKMAIAAIEAGQEIGESAEDVDKWLKEVYQGLYNACEEGASSLHKKGSMEWDDYKTMCELKIDRKWQARNINAVLAWNNDKSLVRRLWEKFKNKLIGWMTDEAKGKLKDGLNVK